MSYSITTLSADLEGVLHGTTTNQITNLFGVYNRAARQLMLDVDPQETKRIVEFTNPIFFEVYDYACPTDLKGNKVIDIRPQTTRYPRDIYSQAYNQAFDVAKSWSWNNDFTINFNTAIKTIRVNSPFLPQGTIVNQATGVTDNGTFSTGGGATGIVNNNINFINFGGSLQFNLSAGPATGYIENSTMSAQNLSSQLNQGTEFVFVYLPVAANFTSVELRWGSSAGNYYSRSVTTNQQGNAFINGWNQLAFNWNGATVVGAPNASAINYLRLTFTYNTTLQTGVLVNTFASRMGAILELEYYSKFLFRDAITGAFQETVTANSNLINLDTESYNLLFNQAAYLAVQQQQGLDASFYDGNFFLTQYKEGVARYQSMYKSELQKPQSIYYAKPNPSYTRFFGRWNY